MARVQGSVPAFPQVPPGGFTVIRDMASAHLTA